MSLPSAARDRFELHEGIFALPMSLLWLERSRALVAADAHFGYEDVIGGALPLWSTQESAGQLLQAVRHYRARELILLGDIVHSSRMNEGAAREVRDALDRLRRACTVTLVAGNHEGHSRAQKILGETEEAVARDGWVLVHGDEPVLVPNVIIGHLHPSLSLGGGATVPAFLATQRTIVVPALTPYSPGLSILARACSDVLRSFGDANDPIVVGSATDRVFPFGSRSALTRALATQPSGIKRFRVR